MSKKGIPDSLPRFVGSQNVKNWCHLPIFHLLAGGRQVVSGEGRVGVCYEDGKLRAEIGEWAFTTRSKWLAGNGEWAKNASSEWKMPGEAITSKPLTLNGFVFIACQ